jgi:membrane fusion protein (multidrug efflux system)
VVIRVPLEGVFERFGSQDVYVIEDGIAKRRAIVLGPVRGGFGEVMEGLQPGETVVSKGVTRVVDGSKVRVVPVESDTTSSPSHIGEP